MRSLSRIGAARELEHLDRHVALGERVAREVDAAGGAAADLADHRVLADGLLRLRLLELHARSVLGDELQQLGLPVGLAEEVR